MESIVTYINLTVEQEEKVYEFLKSKNKIKNIEEMRANFINEVYDYGNGVLFYFEEDELIANICVVLEVAKSIGNGFIHNITLDEENNNLDKAIKSLVNKGISILKEYGASDIRLGITKDVLHIFEDIGFKYEYKSYEMELHDAHKIGDTLFLKEVNLTNIKIYLEIYNDSFRDMPHGTITNEYKIKECLNKDDYYCYFVCDENEEIGFMEVSIENNKGMFDIGLRKKYRGMNYGYRLLETAIEFLVKKNATVNLIVICDNEIAYNMYKKRGFKETLTKSYWMKLEA